MGYIMQIWMLMFNSYKMPSVLLWSNKNRNMYWIISLAIILAIFTSTHISSEVLLCSLQSSNTISSYRIDVLTFVSLNQFHVYCDFSVLIYVVSCHCCAVHTVSHDVRLCHNIVILLYNNFKQIDGLIQERRNSSALAMELRLSCINPSK